MKSVAFTVRLKGDVVHLMDELIIRGYSGSKAELVRTSLIFYAMKLGLISPRSLHQRVLNKIAISGISYSDDEIKEHLEALEYD